MKTNEQSSVSGIRNHPIVQLIKDAMARDGIRSVGEFGERAGLKRTTTYNLVLDKSPIVVSLETLFKLETALETPVAELIEFLRPTSQPEPANDRLEALSALRGKYAGPTSLSQELHDERRAERQ